MTFRKILLAYDFSEPANRALLFVSKLSTGLQAELHLFHVPWTSTTRSDPQPVSPWASQDQRTATCASYTRARQRGACGRRELADQLTFMSCAPIPSNVLRGPSAAWT